MKKPIRVVIAVLTFFIAFQSPFAFAKTKTKPPTDSEKLRISLLTLVETHDSVPIRTSICAPGFLEEPLR